MKIINYKPVLSLSNGLKIFLCFLFLSFFFVHKSYAAVLSRAPNNLGLVAFWPMNEGGGNKAGDFSGNGNTATLTNSPSWASGKHGKALSFDGAFTALRPTSDPIGTGTVTVCAWAKPFTTGDGGFGHILGNGKFEFFLSGGGTYWALNSDGGYGVFTTTAANTIKLNTWQHICAVRLSNGNGTMYYNGSQSGTPDVTGTPAAGTGLTIGEANLVGDYGFNGVIDDVRIYSRALSAAEILALYKSGLVAINSSQSSRLTDGLVGFWPFNGGDVTDKVYDRSGQNNNGGFYGAATSTAKIIGKIGQALKFDGSDDYINVPDPANGSLDFGTATNTTVSAWVNIPSTNPGATFLSKNEFNNPPPGYWFGHSNYAQSDYTAGFEFDTATGYCWVVGNSNIADNTWHQVTAVVFRRASCTTSDILIYVDGVRQNGSVILSSDNTNANISSSEPLRIAADYDGGSLYYSNVKLDEVRIYNRALSAPEVLQLYNLGGDKINSAQISRLTSGLIGFWPFNGGDVTDKVYDRSGQNNNGGFYGGATSTAKTIGKLGQALKFDGVNDEINIATNLINASTVTVCAWIYPRAFTGYHYIIGESTNNFVFGIAQPFNAVYLSSDGLTAAASAVPPTLNSWQHICGIRKSSGLGTIYINGVQSGATDQNTGTPSVSAWNTTIGNARAGGSDLFNGYIDEVRLYNRVLTAGEILQLYNMGR